MSDKHSSKKGLWFLLGLLFTCVALPGFCLLAGSLSYSLKWLPAAASLGVYLVGFCVPVMIYVLGTGGNLAQQRAFRLPSWVWFAVGAPVAIALGQYILLARADLIFWLPGILAAACAPLAAVALAAQRLNYPTSWYKWHLEGFPADKVYSVYQMPAGRPAGKLFGPFHLGDRGFQDVSWGTLGFVRGEPLAVAAMSDDGSVKGYGVVIPFPIQAAGDGGCRMGAELNSTDGTKWLIYGEGFESGEKLAITLRRPDGTLGQATDKANDDGTVDGDVSLNGEGMFSLTLQGRACTVTVEFPSGSSRLQHP
ncbi:MAG: hypothetical protein U0822_03300 [Anaerolineae bacterium]